MKAALAALMLLSAAQAQAGLQAVIVSGLGGEPAYEEAFRRQAESVAAAARNMTTEPADVVVLSGELARRESLQRALQAVADRARPADPLLVVFIGHGSFDGEEYRYNVPGPDMTGEEIGKLLDRLPAGQQLVVNATSSSGAVLQRWKRAGRILVTATRSGSERNATRFAEFWVEALTSGEADRDKNEQVTAAEAFEFASRRVADVYKTDVAIATEHPQLSGDTASRFAVAHLGEAARFSSDPELIALRGEQVVGERSLEQLRARKAELVAEQYYDELEKVLVEIARVDRRIAQRQAVLSGQTRVQR